ncbi:MAG: hypothetical protein CR997_14035 [Acidobacteria bacterium]|nr:MAG: hypothetical protein CR997_14035 [Acidobacteriota bacterium]
MRCVLKFIHSLNLSFAHNSTVAAEMDHEVLQAIEEATAPLSSSPFCHETAATTSFVYGYGRIDAMAAIQRDRELKGQSPGYRRQRSRGLDVST